MLWVLGGGVVDGGLDCDFFSLFSVFTSSGVALLVGVGLVFVTIVCL